MCLAPSLASAETLPCRQRDGGDARPRIGLVLGGGGARGFAHVSVIRELERLNIPVDCIAGSSAGAMIGGFYASGMSAAEIEALVTAVDWRKALDDNLVRPERSFRRKRDDDLALFPAKPGLSATGVRLAPGLLAGEHLQLLLERATQPVARIDDFDRLPIPFRAIATDINNGEQVVLGRGNLSEAMRASMSIPGVFRPVELDGKLLVDGGIANQLPVDVVRAMGADIVIAVDVGTPLRVLTEGASVLAFAEQMSGLLTVRNTEAAIATLGPRDLLVQPEFGDAVSTAEFGKVAEALAIGLEAMQPLEARFSVLARPQAEYRLQLAAQTKRNATPPVIAFVRLNNTSRYSDALVLARLDVAIGQPMDQVKLEDNILRLYGLDTLDRVTYDLIEEDGEAGLLVHVVPHSYGPTYLETGLSVAADFEGGYLVNFRAGALRAPLNALGGEARLTLQLGSEPGLGLDLHQPLDLRGHWFVGGRASFESPRVAVFDDNGRRSAIYQVPGFGVEAYAGREFGNYGAATLGWRRRVGKYALETGVPTLAGESFNVGELWWSLTLDRLDNFVLPHAGSYVNVGGVHSRSALGADSDFDQAHVDALFAHAIGRHSGFAGFRYHSTVNGQAPLQSQFRPGGVTRFAGYRPGERVTPNYALAFAGYTYELGRLMDRPAMLGGTLEYGQLWAPRPEPVARRGELHGSLYFAFDSWLGRFLLGYGLREDGKGTAFLELGRAR